MNEQVTEPTEIETQALKDGWTPEDRYDPEEHDGRDFVSAEKFVENGSFFKKIKAQKERIDDLVGTVEELTEHYEKSTKVQLKKAKDDYEQKITDLKAEQVQAMDDGEHKRAVEIGDQIRREPEPEPESEDFKTKLAEFKNNNSWYEDDMEMTRFADMVGRDYAPRASSNKDFFKKLNAEIKARFPDKFENPNRNNAQTVEGDKPSKPGKKGFTEKDLTADEKTAYMRFKHNLKTDEAKSSYLKSVLEVR